MKLKALNIEDLRKIEGGSGEDPKSITILGNVIFTNGVGNQNP